MADAATAFRRAYEARLHDGWDADEAQEAAVAQMARLLSVLPPPPRRAVKGLYLHGPVGRGKSQLLNLFMEHVGGVPARRTHMHTFMSEVHQRLFDIKSGDPIVQTAGEMAEEFRVLGFDEFYVTNIADAMLLGRLFEHLFKQGIVVVATSNWPMEDLYQGGRNRKSFLPFLRVLERNMHPVDLGDGRDYRRTDDDRWPLYVIAGEDGAPQSLQALFERYAEGESVCPPSVAAARAIRGRCGWFCFEDLCERPLGRAEYMELMSSLDTLIVEGLPVFAPDHSETALRFVTLIDICYELRRRVIVMAEDYPESLYAEGPVVTAFRRAASRLAEMQGWE